MPNAGVLQRLGWSAVRVVTAGYWEYIMNRDTKIKQRLQRRTKLSLASYVGPRLCSRLATTPLLQAVARAHQYIHGLLERTRQPDADSREVCFIELAHALRTYAACQEASLYRSADARPELADLIDEARQGQRYVVRYLREVERKRPDELLWEVAFARVDEAACNLLHFEIDSVLPRALDVLDQDRLDRIVERFVLRSAAQRYGHSD